ncbi:hypothetical protein [Microbacterium sp. S16(2024)]|uniref:hypothetical protein n=1 Tax=Microbacterium sp. S16(2024) TaxID=3368601 RepID=UPI00373F2149
MKTIAAALAGGRFVTRWTFVTVIAVSLIVLAPLPAALTPVERATVSLMTAAMFAAAWGLVAVIERRVSAPVARAAIVATALVVTAILRPVGQDALSLALGIPGITSALDRLKNEMIAHNAVIMTVLFAVLAANEAAHLIHQLIA